MLLQKGKTEQGTSKMVVGYLSNGCEPPKILNKSVFYPGTTYYLQEMTYIPIEMI